MWKSMIGIAAFVFLAAGAGIGLACEECEGDAAECPKANFLADDDDPECPCPDNAECPKGSLIINSVIEWNRQSGGIRLSSQGSSVLGQWGQSRVPSQLLEFGRLNGEQVAVPVGFHAVNRMWISQSALEKFGGSVPATIDDLLAMLPRARDAGLIPVAVGGEPWQLMQLFRAIVAAQGYDLYQRALLEHQVEALTSPEFATAVEQFKTIMSYSDAGSANRNWVDTASIVARGDAVFQVMGTWAAEQYRMMSDDPGDIVCPPFPGTGEGVVFDSPVMFAMPEDREQGDNNLSYVGDDSFVGAFAAANKFLPSAPGIDSELLDGCGGGDPLDDPVEASNVVPAWPAAADSFLPALQDELFALSWSPDTSVDEFQQRLVNAANDAEVY